MNIYTTDKIRNVVLLGHGGSGKTSLTEAMAYLAGMTNRLGRVEDGNTVSDFDKEEQKRRFCERMENPEKRWKITDEDLRNREKWDLYEHAADEMIMRTSTAYAPWVIVEGNDKYYARIKVLKTVTDAIEKRLKER
mgnify:CR=1 FL=1